jgi:hypothetical protein
LLLEALIAGNERVDGGIELGDFFGQLLEALLALAADEFRQLEVVRILFGTLAFARLLTHSAFALVDQDFELFFDWPQRPGGQRFWFQTKASHDLGIDLIVLGPAQPRKSEELHLSGVEYTNRQARLVEGGNQGLALNPSAFQGKMDLRKFPMRWQLG